MTPEDKLSALYALTAAKLAELKATQEIILKTQSHFLAKLSGSPWEPIFEDLRAQARTAAGEYKRQTLAEFEALRHRPGTPPADAAR